MLEFSEAYNKVYKQKFAEKVNEYFQSLVTQSAVNVDENKRSSAKYRDQLASLDSVSKKLSSVKGWRIFLIVMLILSAVGTLVFGIILINNSGDEVSTYLILALVCLAILIASIVLLCTVIKNKIKKFNEQKSSLEKIVAELYNKCWKQVQPLHALFNKSVLYKLIEETLPIVDFDENFNNKRLDILENKYGMSENVDPNQSTVGVFSGEILGNPFVEERRFVMTMGTCTYTGTLVIHWTTTRTDSEGHLRTEHHSQTLVATVVKPKPYYTFHTQFVFGCDAAPNLSFSHQPTHAERLNEKQLKRKVEKDSKLLKKQAEKAVQNGGSNFTEMGNQEFDALFNAEDRDNEVEFRLMFTPLAQKNLLHLMKTPDPYGDDFDFIKSKKLNIIISEHAQNWQFDENFDDYKKYDVDLCKKAFLNFYEGFFRNFYFEVAPLMCIPLYQQFKSTEYIYRNSYERNYTSFESEVLANLFDSSLFAHDETETEVILKTRLLSKVGNNDNLGVAAYSFKTVEHVEYVSKLGGDGCFHDVPVIWYEYVPLEKYSEIEVTSDQTNDKSNKVSKHGLCAIFKN